MGTTEAGTAPRPGQQGLRGSGSSENISTVTPSRDTATPGGCGGVTDAPTLKGYIIGGRQVGKSALLSRLSGKDPFVSRPPTRKDSNSSVTDAGDNAYVKESEKKGNYTKKDAVLLPWRAPPQMLCSSVHLPAPQNETSGRAKFLVIDDVPVTSSTTKTSSVQANQQDDDDHGQDTDEVSINSAIAAVSTNSNSSISTLGINFLIGMIDPQNPSDDGKEERASIDVLEEQIVTILKQSFSLPTLQSPSQSNNDQEEATSDKTFSISPEEIKTLVPIFLLMNFRDCILPDTGSKNESQLSGQHNNSGKIVFTKDFEEASKHLDLLVARLEREMSRVHITYLETLSSSIEKQIRALALEEENESRNSTKKEELINLHVCASIIEGMLHDHKLNKNHVGCVGQQYVWGIHASMKNCFGLQALQASLRIPYLTYINQQCRMHACLMRHRQWPLNVHSLSESIHQNNDFRSYENFRKRLVLKKQQQQRRQEQLKMQKLKIQQKKEDDRVAVEEPKTPETKKPLPDTEPPSDDSQEQRKKLGGEITSSSQVGESSTVALHQEKVELQRKLERLRKLQGASATSITAETQIQNAEPERHVLPRQNSNSSSGEHKKSKRKDNKQKFKMKQDLQSAAVVANNQETMSAFSRVQPSQPIQRPSSQNSNDGYAYFSHQNRIVASSSTTSMHLQEKTAKKEKAPYDPQSPINIQKQMEARRRKKELEKKQQQKYLQQRATSKTMDAQKALDLFLADSDSASDDNTTEKRNLAPSRKNSSTSRSKPKLQPKNLLQAPSKRNVYITRSSSSSSSSSEEDVFYDEQGNRMHARQRHISPHDIKGITKRPMADHQYLSKPVPVVARHGDVEEAGLAPVLTQKPTQTSEGADTSESSDELELSTNQRRNHLAYDQLARKTIKDEKQSQDLESDIGKESEPALETSQPHSRADKMKSGAVHPQNDYKPTNIRDGKVFLSDDSEDDEAYVINESIGQSQSPHKHSYVLNNDSDSDNRHEEEEEDFPVEKEPIVASKKYHRVESPTCLPLNEELRRTSTADSAGSTTFQAGIVSSPTRSEAVKNAIAEAEANAKKTALENKATLSIHITTGEETANKLNNAVDETKKKKKKKKDGAQSSADKAAKKERKEKKKKKKEKKEAVADIG